MSSENRKKVLLGFGALVVILVAAIALWPPNFRKEDASGAIGEVQKHRAPQITQKDVVLGNESVKRQQQVLYADFLADATKLKALGHAEQAQLAEFDQQMAARWLAEAEQVLADEQAAARSQANRKTLDAEMAEAASMIRNHRGQFNAEEMTLANGKLAHIADELNMSSRVKLADEQLAAAVNALASAKLQSQYLGVAKQLDAVTTELKSEELFAISLSDEIEYLQETALNARIATGNVSEEALAQRSEELVAHAMKNMEEQLADQQEMANKFRDMDDQIARAQRVTGSEAAMASNSQLAMSLRDTEQALSARDNEFRARANASAAEELMAVKGLDARMYHTEQLQTRLADFEQTLAHRQAQ